jgi:hypothetical protein
MTMATLELVALVACNAAFVLTIAYLFLTRMMDKFVKYFLVGEYLVAMVPLSAIGILLQQTTMPIVLIFLIHIGLLFILGVIPNYFQRKP